MMNSLAKPCSRSGVRSQACRPAPGTQRRVLVRSGDGGLQDLLARDKKLAGSINVVPELSDEPTPEQVLSKQASSETVVKSRRRRQEDMSKAAETQDPNRPKTCKKAIDKGLELFAEKKFSEAIDMFNLALELPGNGAYRLPDSPREFSCPSDAEENAALYNMACAYAQMGKKDSAMACIEAILDNGFSDYDTIRKDPDLAPCKGNQLDLLIFKYQNPVSQAMNPIAGLFNMGKKPEVSDPNQKKPWLLW